MIKQDILENQVRYSYLSIGSNLGNKKYNIEKTIFLLNEKKIKILKKSSIYETFSWPNKYNPKFYNLVVEIKTNLNQFLLLKLLKVIENEIGRKKSIINSPRVCDIDIIDYNGRVFNNSYLKLPHPRMKKREFVLLPLMEICNNWTYPGSKTKISTLIKKISQKNLRSIKIV